MNHWEFISFAILCVFSAFMLWMGLQRKISPTIGDAWEQLQAAKSPEEKSAAHGTLALAVLTRLMATGYWGAVAAIVAALAAVISPDRVWFCIVREVSRLVHLLLSMPPPEVCTPGDV